MQSWSTFPTLSHGKSYVFYEVANSYDLTWMILYDLSKPQWWVGLGAGLGVGHSYKFIRIGNLLNTYDLAKIIWICTSEVVRISHLIKYVRIAVRLGWLFSLFWPRTTHLKKSREGRKTLRPSCKVCQIEHLFLEVLVVAAWCLVNMTLWLSITTHLSLDQ